MEPRITVTAPATAGVLTAGGLGGLGGGFGGGGLGGLELPVIIIRIQMNTIVRSAFPKHGNTGHKGESQSQGAHLWTRHWPKWLRSGCHFSTHY